MESLTPRAVGQVGWQLDVRHFAREVGLVLLGAGFLALLAQVIIPIPGNPVPITAQTLAVLVMGAFLGRYRGASATAVYVLAGTLGAPVFAGGMSGVARLFGPTGGYLLGFIAAAYLVGWLSERGWFKRLSTALFASILGMAVIYVLGLAQLAAFLSLFGDTSLATVVMVGFVPFVPGAVLKIYLAMAILRPLRAEPLGPKALRTQPQEPSAD